MTEGNRSGKPLIEWPTVMLVFVCMALWMLLVWLAGVMQFWWLLPLVALPVALHSSLQHEIIHGHPTRWPVVNAALVFPAVGLFLPFHRFRDLHMQHHGDCDLSDPRSDPESPYLTETAWNMAGPVRRSLWRCNASLAGRLIIGPVMSVGGLIHSDIRAIGGGQLRIVVHWLLHIPALLPVLIWLQIAGVPVWLYALMAAWPGMSILMLRTFAEHRWHPDVQARSVTVKRGGIFALLFLNNHLHAAHHHSPALAWYRLPELSQRLERDGRIRGDVFDSYAEIAGRWLFRVRSPIVQPREAAQR